MEWSKENLGKLYFEKFGVTLTPEDMDYEWGLVESNRATPRGDKMNIAASPLWIKNYIERDLARSGLTLSDPRFKKVREEIIPAIDYALFLKKTGWGEYLICSSDSPDIILVNKEKKMVQGSPYRVMAIPLEVTFIKDSSIQEASGDDAAEKLVSVLVKNKLDKSYGAHTTLLVVVDALLDYIELEKIVLLLKDKAKNFHSISLLFSEKPENYVLACVYPKLATWELDVKKDLDPLMY